MAPTDAQLKAVASDWGGCDKDKFVLTLYHKMFQKHPAYENLFKNFDHPQNDGDPKFKKQADVTRDMLNTAITTAGGGDMAGLGSALKALGTRHVNYGVGQEHFQSLKPILKEVVSEVVSGADAGAWAATMGYVLDNIKP